MKTVAELEGISEALLDRDILGFVRGRMRFNAIKRWVTTRQDELEREMLADYICERIKDSLLDRQKDQI